LFLPGHVFLGRTSETAEGRKRGCDLPRYMAVIYRRRGELEQKDDSLWVDTTSWIHLTPQQR
jgi:hypothetical protein